MTPRFAHGAPCPTSHRSPRRFRIVLALLVGSAICLPWSARSQDLAPRAYLISPVSSNAVTVSYGFFNGNLDFDGTVPITDAKSNADVSSIAYVTSLSVFGRSANFLEALPYGVADFSGTAFGTQTSTRRSGLFPATFRFAVNLHGGPAMRTPEFVRWHQKTLVGASLKVVPPSGQYDSTKLINLGTNRWAIKPELGLSRRWGHWILDAYSGVWFYTTNPAFFSQNKFNPGVNTQSQNPTGAFETHLSYDVKPRLWASLDGNFWFGGATSLNNIENPKTTNRNSRVGATVSFPLGKRESLKLSYNDGAYIQYGGNYQNVTVGWQYSWINKYR